MMNHYDKLSNRLQQLCYATRVVCFRDSWLSEIRWILCAKIHQKSFQGFAMSRHDSTGRCESPFCHALSLSYRWANQSRTIKSSIKVWCNKCRYFQVCIKCTEKIKETTRITRYKACHSHVCLYGAFCRHELLQYALPNETFLDIYLHHHLRLLHCTQ